MIDKVSFVIAGTQKGGTSALDLYLREHPELCMPGEKEVHFFDTDELFRTERVDYSVYRANFAPAPSQRLLSDATPIYRYWESAPRRIWQYNPGMKLIIVLRNPVTRAFSQWNMQRERGIDPHPFLDAVRAEPQRLRTVLPRQHRRFSYVDRGFYCEQIRRIWRYFPVEQTLALKSEELRQTPQRVLQRIARFLCIGEFPAVLPKDVHSRPYASAMTAEESGI